MAKASTEEDDRVVLLGLAHLVHKMCDCATEMNAPNAEAAVRQFNVVQKLCRGRPLFSDCYLTMPMAPIHAFSAKNRLLNLESSKTAQDAENLRSMVDRMTNIEHLILLTFCVNPSHKWNGLK